MLLSRDLLKISEIYDLIRNNNDSDAIQKCLEGLSLLDVQRVELQFRNLLLLATHDPNILLSEELFLFLVKHTRNKNAKDVNGCTVIHYLSAYNDVGFLNHALAHLDINMQNNKGNTATLIASYHNHENMLRILLRHGGDPNKSNIRGQTPLHWACFKGSFKCAEQLLQAGAKVNACDSRNRHAVHYLAQSNIKISIKIKLLLLLIHHGANIDIVDEQGNTALMVAEENMLNSVFSDMLRQRRVPSLTYLCARYIAKVVNDNDRSVESLGLPSELNELLRSNLKCM